MLRPPPTSTLFPYTTLFRSVNGKVTDQVDYLTATDEERYVIAQANAPLKDDGSFVNDRVLVRRGSGDVEYVPPKDRKSTRLNSSHVRTSYAVFCLKKKTARS